MARLPEQREAFAEHVATLFHRLYPEAEVRLTGPGNLKVGGRRLDLDNLYRLVAQDPDRGVEIAEQFIESLFAGDAIAADAMPFDLARPMIMPRIHPESIFKKLERELVAHIPFVNGTVILFVLDLPQMTVSVTSEQAIRWGVEPEDLERIARKNLQETTPSLEVRFIESKEGGKAALFSHHDGYDAARLLLGGLFGALAPELGGDFLVGTPSRDVFVALSRDPGDFVSRVRDRIQRDYEKLPYPITTDLFYVTRDGVAGAAAA
jgi:uncharacterized protein YtpQ (UPF0354 family)